jgi:hypothetical protein
MFRRLGPLKLMERSVRVSQGLHHDPSTPSDVRNAVVGTKLPRMPSPKFIGTQPKSRDVAFVQPPDLDKD